MEKRRLKLKINGEEIEVFGDPSKPLLNLLREDLGLMGTKEGCGKGECGACTILFDGNPVPSCLLLAAQAEGHEIVTIEGLSRLPGFSYLEDAFIEEGAVQCGFCTPGFVVSAYALIVKNPNPGEEDIKEALSGNLCRCTGYVKIIKAVKKAALNFWANIPEGVRNA